MLLRIASKTPREIEVDEGTPSLIIYPNTFWEIHLKKRVSYNTWNI